MIEKCLTALARQENVVINLIVVVRFPNKVQLDLIRKLSKPFNGLKIVIQKGEASQNRAYLLALKHTAAKYVSILSVDSTILGNSLHDLVSLANLKNADVAFGIAFPETADTAAGQFTGIEKLFRQLLLIKGRGLLGFGYYFPGNFAIIRTKKLSKFIKKVVSLHTFAMYDLGLMLKLYSSGNAKLAFLDQPVVTEAERTSFSSWALQNSRWFIGTIGLYHYQIKFFLKAKIKERLGWLGVIWSWRILPVSLVLGLLFIILTGGKSQIFIALYLITYLLLTAILLSIKEIREYKFIYIIFHWFVASTIKFVAVILSIYEYIFVQYNQTDLSKLFKR